MFKALICGRGQSLEYYKKIKESEFDYVYLVNAFNLFIREDLELLAFLTNMSQKTHLIQQINVCAVGVDGFLLQNLQVKEILITRLPHNNEDVWWREHVDTPAMSMAFGRIVDLQPEIISKHMSHIENSLGVAILNCILDKGCKEITIIGSDFYEADYFLSHKNADWGECSRKETQDRLKKGFDYLISEFSDVQFNIFTCSSYENNSSNCNITRIE